MLDKRVWTGAIALVTLIVAGAGALPELLLRPASTGPSVALPVSAPRVELAARPEQAIAVASDAPLPVGRIDTIALPEQAGVAPELPTPEPQAAVAPTTPAPPVAFPPVQPVGVAAAGVQDAVPPPANPEAKPESPPRAIADKPILPERAAQRPTRPRQNVRPAAYPIGEFLAWRR